MREADQYRDTEIVQTDYHLSSQTSLTNGRDAEGNLNYEKQSSGDLKLNKT